MDGAVSPCSTRPCCRTASPSATSPARTKSPTRSARMAVRGAPLIGVSGAYGLAIALDHDASDAGLAGAHDRLLATRPTAVNLRWALDIVRREVAGLPQGKRADAAFAVADRLAEEDVATNAAIAENGMALVRKAYAGQGPGRPGQHPHPLQYRLDRLRRLGHGARHRLPLARCRHSGACLGRRDAAAQPGRQPDDLGTGRPRRAAYADRRQCRRPSDAARQGRPLPGRRRPHHRRRRRRQQDRHLSEGARRGRQQRAVLCRRPRQHHRLDAQGRGRRDRDRGTRARRGDAYFRRAGRRNAGAGAAGARGHACRQPGLRRDAGAADHRHRHRTRGCRCLVRRAGRAVPRAPRPPDPTGARPSIAQRPRARLSRAPAPAPR